MKKRRRNKMIDHADLLEAQGAYGWDNEEDEASYRRWLDSVMVEEMYNEEPVEKILHPQEDF
jgi:hypothetical protein